MKCLVTGCAGFIGSHLTEALLDRGDAVVGVDCFNDNYGRPQKLENLEQARAWEAFDFVPVDLARGDLQDLVEGCDVVFHLAAEPGVRASWGGRFETYVRNNLLATHHLIEALRNTEHARLVYASSSSVYGQAETFPTSEETLPRPFSPYGITKLSAEQLCGVYASNFGLNSVSLRFFSVYGPRQRPDMAFTKFCRAAVADQPIEVFGDGTQTRDFTFVRDVVNALLLAAEGVGVTGRVFNVGGGSQISLNHALAMLEEISGKRLRVERHQAEKGDVRDTGADTTKARAELGYRPLTSLEDGLRQQFAWAVGQQSGVRSLRAGTASRQATHPL